MKKKHRINTTKCHNKKNKKNEQIQKASFHCCVLCVYFKINFSGYTLRFSRNDVLLLGIYSLRLCKRDQ